MNISAPFIRRPVATVLLSLGLFVAGLAAYRFLPVSALPNVDIPTVVVFTSRPGAAPETMASSVTAPLERHLGTISGVTELTSTSTDGAASIVVQFDVDRDLDGAAHDVQAALNATVADLPAELPTAPYYRKFNPADAPIMTLALTSGTRPLSSVYDLADTLLGQRLSQIDGVGHVSIYGAETPAVRVRLDPAALHAAGLAAQDVVNVIRGANVTQPLGGFQGPLLAGTIAANGQMSRASEYARLIVKQTGGAAIRLGDVASVIDGTANTRLAAWDGRTPAILVNITKLSGANVIDTVDRVRAALPQLLAWMPAGIHVDIISDRTTTIRASVQDVQYTLLVTVVLVLLVVLLFMRRVAPTLAAAVTVPLSIAGTFGGMWLLGFSLNNFSLMALTISVGFVVDDAIVMIENIFRLIEAGRPPLAAAIEGARQIGFTVLSITVSLVAVFIPILFMGGLLGRLFHEFAVTLTMAITVSALVSLTLTPVICARIGGRKRARAAGLAGRLDAAVERGLAGLLRGYAASLALALRFRRLMLLVTLATVVLTVLLYREVPKGFLPPVDTGLLMGSTEASPDISFHAMAERQGAVVETLLRDPAVETVGSVVGISSGFSSLNRGMVAVQLKPFAARRLSSEAVIARLRGPLARIGGIQTFLQSGQDLRGGGRSGGGQYQFVLLGQDVGALRLWTQRLEARLRQEPGIADVGSDEDQAAPQATVVIDRDAAARLGVTVTAVDAALGNAFAQRQVSTIYTDRNQYRVVLEIDPALQADPSAFSGVYVGTDQGRQVPLLSVARVVRGDAPLAVRHQGQFPAATLSFNLGAGTALGDATALVERAARALRMPESVHYEFAGNARFLTDSLRTQPMLIGAALLAIYIVLGVLYESLIHPLTILSSLPSAGLGALLAVLVTGTDLSVMSIIGIVLLMGIVKKNAIMLVDFALEAERDLGMTPQEAIHAASLERFRPIIMTTLAALFGALPLALSFGTGSELRRPLGIAIVGGLVVSQVLTLYTTPVVYLALERLARGRRARLSSLPAE